MRLSSSQYLVTTILNDIPRSRFWNGNDPLPVGFENTAKLTLEAGQVYYVPTSGNRKKVSTDGSTLALPGLADAEIRIQEIARTQLRNRKEDLPSGRLEWLLIQRHHGQLLDSNALVGSHKAATSSHAVFTLRRQKNGFSYRSHHPDVRINGSDTRSRMLTWAEARKTRVSLGQREWTLIGTSVPTLETSRTTKDSDTRWFQRALPVVAASISLLIFGGVIFSRFYATPVQKPAIVRITLPPSKKATPPQYLSHPKELLKGVSKSKLPVRKKTTRTAQKASPAASPEVLKVRRLKGSIARLLGKKNSMAITTTRSAPMRKGSLLDASNSAKAVPAVAVKKGKLQVAFSSGPNGKSYRWSVNGRELLVQGGAFLPMHAGSSRSAKVVGLKENQVKKVVEDHFSEIKNCYEIAVISNPKVDGKIVVDFEIAQSGSIRTATVSSSTVPSDRLGQCVVKRLRNWKFPKPVGGISVAVTYPFVFRSL